MATAVNNDNSRKHIHIQAIQSIIPGKVTDPGQSRRLNIRSPLSDAALQSHLRAVLYFKHDGGDSSEQYSAVAMAAWAKETVSAALSEHPVLAGRLRREREGEGWWEVKYNDAGVRMVQATAEASMEEFLREEMEEGVLGYWIDVDREKPEMSALFYIQVTEFQGNGYSIGISCSLLLADPLFLTQFLKKWAVAHSSMLAQAHPKTPIFHLNYFRIPQRPSHLKSIPFDRTQPKPTAKTILFKSNPNQTPKLNHTTLASICIEKATHMLDINPLLKFSLIVNNPNPNGDLTVGSCQGEELVHSDVYDGAVAAASMDEFGLDELAMSEGNTPVHVSCGVVTSCESEGLVVVMMPGYDDGVSEVLISVTIPKE